MRVILLLAFLSAVGAVDLIRVPAARVLRAGQSAAADDAAANAAQPLRVGEKCTQPSPCDSSPVHDVSCKGEMVEGRGDLPVCTCRCSQVVFVSNAREFISARRLQLLLLPLPLTLP